MRSDSYVLIFVPSKMLGTGSDFFVYIFYIVYFYRFAVDSYRI